MAKPLTLFSNYSTALPRAPRPPRPVRTCRHYSDQRRGHADKPATDAPHDARNSESDTTQRRAMSRRLEEATEEALLTGGRAGRRAVEEAGFSEDLKERLFNKIADANFRAEHVQTLTSAGINPSTLSKLPGSSGEGTRAMATGPAWTGEEPQAEAVLRMLDDATKHLPPHLRGKPKIPTPTMPVDMRIRRDPTISPGRRVASARDKASAYSGLGLKGAAASKGLTDKEREELRQEFRERFTPGARGMPSTMAGLAALANKRIENAIARGQFKDIPRGKGVERDPRSNNPFIDTTEYIMNKMIKRQDIVPPWIEKQQEVVRTASVFRLRLRNDWRRHAARSIAAAGGTLEAQMARAREYAMAEEVKNPRRRNVDQISVPSNSTDDPVIVKMRQLVAEESDHAPGASSESMSVAGDETPVITQPFRDPTWEAAERSYMELSIANLNAMTRSYNLMAPELAKKAYFSLERELASCFADVAPQLAGAIKDRAATPAKSSLVGDGGTRPAGILDRFGGERTRSTIYDSRAPHYGFKEMWRDLWNKPA